MLELSFDPFPVLETKSLLLRRIVDTDVEALFAIRSNPIVMEAINKERFKSLEETQNLINIITKNLEETNGISWAVCFKENGNYVGNVSFHRIHKEHHRAEIGYALLPEYHRRGFMDEAVKALIDFGFIKLGLHSIEAFIYPVNQASKGILEKNGFKQEGLLKESFFFRTTFSDTAIYSLLNPNRNKA